MTWDTFNKTLTHQFRADRSETTITDFDLEFPPPAFITRNEGERTTYGYLGTYRFDTPALWGARHTISGLVEQRDGEVCLHGRLLRPLAAPARARVLCHGMERHLRRPGVGHCRRAPRRQRRVRRFHHLEAGRKLGGQANGYPPARQYRHGREVPDYVRAVRQVAGVSTFCGQPRPAAGRVAWAGISASSSPSAAPPAWT